ncbi:MAG: TRAP transporter TatT component family protein [Desulfomonilia bacterium]|jgi:tetratricopeptide (TPR) repeat protein
MTLRSFNIAPWLLILTIIVFLSGCAHEPPEEPPTGSYLEDIYSKANTNPDVDKFCNAMSPYLQYIEPRIPLLPDDLTFVFRVSGAYYGYAFSCMEDTDKKEASLLYLKGRDLSLDELKRYRIFTQALNDTVQNFREALPKGLDKRDLQAIYWTAVNWAGWINLNLEKPEAIADIPKVEAMLEFLNTLDESYNNGTVHAVLGTLYANRPKAEGGDPEKAKEQFDKAFTYSGNSLFTIHVMYAKFYACRIQDRELFKKTLEQVIGTPANTYADKTFVNEVARRKAKVLLEHIDTYFKAAETKKNPEAGTTP